jgi:hypothetical protein
MDFLNHREGGCGFLSGFPPFSFTVYSNRTIEAVRGCVSLKIYKYFDCPERDSYAVHYI